MIKKNLFILFCIYFFTIQPVICGVLRNENNFFRLALINFVFILLITILWKDKDADNDEKKSHLEKDDKAPQYQIHNIQKKSKVKISEIRFFIIAILFGILCRYRLWDIVTHLRFIISIVWSYIIYIILWLIFKIRVFKTRESILYMVLITIWCVWWIIKILNINLPIQNNPTQEIEDINENTWDTENEILINENDIITWTNVWSWFVDIDTESNEIIDTNTWTQEIEVIETTNNVDLTKNATFMDIIKFLLADENLLTDTKISFTYVSKTNEDYKYFRTAYDKKMIWKDTNPNKTPLCETYVVMKWLAKWWQVWTYTDIKKAYRNYATNNNELPSCKYGRYVTLWDLK